MQKLLAAPRWIRYIFARLPKRVLPNPVMCCHVMAFDSTGRPIHNLSGDSTRINLITSVREQQGTVFMGSINSNAIARFRLPARDGASG